MTDQLDILKIQSDHALRARKVIDRISLSLGLSLISECPKEHQAGWITQTLANLVAQTLYDLTKRDVEKTKFYAQAVREALGREFYTDD